MDSYWTPYYFGDLYFQYLAGTPGITGWGALEAESGTSTGTGDVLGVSAPAEEAITYGAGVLFPLLPWQIVGKGHLAARLGQMRGRGTVSTPQRRQARVEDETFVLGLDAWAA